MPAGLAAGRGLHATSGSRAGGGRTRVRMNCSGKHAAMMLTCQANGWPVDGYPAADHPLQRHLAEAVGRPRRRASGGCGRGWLRCSGFRDHPARPRSGVRPTCCGRTRPGGGRRRRHACASRVGRWDRSGGQRIDGWSVRTTREGRCRGGLRRGAYGHRRGGGQDRRRVGSGGGMRGDCWTSSAGDQRQRSRRARRGAGHRRWCDGGRGTYSACPVHALAFLIWPSSSRPRRRRRPTPVRTFRRG